MAEVTVVSLEEKQWEGQAVVWEALADSSSKKTLLSPLTQRDPQNEAPFPREQAGFPPTSYF